MLAECELIVSRQRLPGRRGSTAGHSPGLALALEPRSKPLTFVTPLLNCGALTSVPGEIPSQELLKCLVFHELLPEQPTPRRCQPVMLPKETSRAEGAQVLLQRWGLAPTLPSCSVDPRMAANLQRRASHSRVQRVTASPASGMARATTVTLRCLPATPCSQSLHHLPTLPPGNSPLAPWPWQLLAPPGQEGFISRGFIQREGVAVTFCHLRTHGFDEGFPSFPQEALVLWLLRCAVCNPQSPSCRRGCWFIIRQLKICQYLGRKGAR